MAKKNTGTSMQGRIEKTKKGYKRGKALCSQCKYFKYGYYCEKYNNAAHFPKKKKLCKYYRKETNWTPEEEELLMELISKKETPKNISKILNRTFKEIDKKYNELENDN